MTIKAVEMVRKIRDQHYEQTKNRSVDEQIKFIREKSNKLQRNSNAYLEWVSPENDIYDEVFEDEVK
jgi:hypothetical protein